MQYTLVHCDGESFITVMIPGQPPLVAQSDHPNFEAIREGAANEDESIADLFDVTTTVATRFESLTERVSVAHGRIYLDGDEIDNSLSRAILRFLDEGVEDWRPLALFFEKVLANPNDHSREQLYDWLNAHEFTLTPEGDIVGYKGVQASDDGGYESCSSGRAIVDGEPVEGRVPNAVGSVVEMPRSEVAHNPSDACSTGLHVGTYDYAQQWARAATLEVHVNPRDVVSVPTDASGEKVRVCRYYVASVIEGPHDGPVAPEAETLD